MRFLLVMSAMTVESTTVWMKKRDNPCITNEQSLSYLSAAYAQACDSFLIPSLLFPTISSPKSYLIPASHPSQPYLRILGLVRTQWSPPYLRPVGLGGEREEGKNSVVKLPGNELSSYFYLRTGKGQAFALVPSAFLAIL